MLVTMLPSPVGVLIILGAVPGAAGECLCRTQRAHANVPSFCLSLNQVMASQQSHRLDGGAARLAGAAQKFGLEDDTTVLTLQRTVPA
jgi:hypothetical protein